MNTFTDNSKRMTVADLHFELSRLMDAGKQNIPVFAGDFDLTGILWIKDNSTQEFNVNKANAVLLEYE